MTLDTETLRVAFGVVVFTMLVLFYTVTFRATRSLYSAWWCASLALFLVGASGYLLNGTGQQYWANPAGNFLLVLGTAAAWAAARTLHAQRPPWWQLLFLPLLTVIVSSLDQPGSNVWAGAYIFLLAMSVNFGLTAYELWQLERDQTHMQVLLAVAAGGSGLYYFGRWIAFLAQGVDGDIFNQYFGSVPTTILNLIFMSMVSFSMAELSQEQTTKELTNRATRDGLTGLLNRTEFLRLAIIELRRLRRAPTNAALVLVDLDHFKEINDTFGHAEGDEVLRNFANACRQAVRSTDLVGRYGGEEFILFLPGISLDRAEQIIETINGQFADMRLDGALVHPSASYGVGLTELGVPLDKTIVSVDAALYQAKRLGRSRICRANPIVTTPGREAQPSSM